MAIALISNFCVNPFVTYVRYLGFITYWLQGSQGRRVKEHVHDVNGHDFDFKYVKHNELNMSTPAVLTYLAALLCLL